MSNYVIGQVGGLENVTLLMNNLPPHAHSVPGAGLTGTINGQTAAANSKSPAGAVPATEAAGVTATYSTDTSGLTPMASSQVTIGGTAMSALTGSGLPVNTLNPYLTLNYCIALNGIFPSRN